MELEDELASDPDPTVSRGVENVAAVHLPESTILQPRAQAANYVPPLPVDRESTAVTALEILQLQKDNDVEFTLDDFDIYSMSKKYGARLCPLHFLLDDRKSHARLYFDGILSAGSQRYYVERVPFSKVPVGNSGVDYESVDREIWIQSELNARREVYYRIGRPSVAYARFFRPFLWVADLAKHVYDYCDTMLKDGEDVRLWHFQTHFARWLHQAHPRSAALQRGSSTGDGSPGGLQGKDRIRSLGWIRLVTCQMYQMHEHKHQASPMKGGVQPTVVTPFVYALFSHLAIGEYLWETPGKGVTGGLDASAVLPQHRAPFRTGPADSKATSRITSRICPGDVISVVRDAETSDTRWKDDGERSLYWYPFVHRTATAANGKRFLDVAWLYAPEHTPCQEMQYPWANELFMSRHCTCEEQGNHISERDVAGIHSVEWFGGPDTTADFFVRQTYLHKYKQWVQLRAEHTLCNESRCALGQRSLFFASPDGPTTDRPFATGDTVLAVTSTQDRVSQPYEIDSFHYRNGDSPARMVRLRQLRRRRQVAPAARSAAVNELVHTERYVSTLDRNIIGRCTVRVFAASAAIPSPYNRAGVGNLFFITHKEVAAEGKSWYAPNVCVPPQDGEKLSLRQGFDPTRKDQKKLRAFDLFCGCGNLSRGLVDSQAIETHWLNDIWSPSIHTAMANMGSTDAEPFLGSMDEMLRRALAGQYSRAVPAPGEVEVISGGSPCQGFSPLTQDKSTPAQYKNRSMVAGFASMIDVYRPKYGLLESVVRVVSKKKSDKAERDDIFGQLICAFVGMGYQVNIMLGNAWSSGAPQRRQRVFLFFAAPGFALPETPLPSHSSPPHGGCRSIGAVSNGESISEAVDVPTAFPFVSIGEATADLQRGAGRIGDSIVDTCIPFPDYRLPTIISNLIYRQIGYLAIFPYGMNIPKTMAMRGETPESPIPQTLFKEQFLHDRLSTESANLHWSEKRPLSVLEVRRAQAVPDNEVLIGLPKDQWRMVGNAVARSMALALGLAVRAAWLGSLSEELEDDRRPMTMTTTTTAAAAAAAAAAATVDTAETVEIGDSDSGMATLATSPPIYIPDDDDTD